MIRINVTVAMFCIDFHGTAADRNIALVTGGVSGIGAAAATRSKRAGYAVVLTYCGNRLRSSLPISSSDHFRGIG